MNETFTNIVATFIVALAITLVCTFVYIVSYVIGIEHPELVVAIVLIVTLSFEYKNKLLNQKK